MNNVFSHTNLDGLYVWDLYPNAEVQSENLINKKVNGTNKDDMLTEENALEIARVHFDAWKDSDFGHYENMINPEWTYFGYGVGFGSLADQSFRSFGCQQFR